MADGAPGRGGRIAAIDIARGGAIVAMVVYHTIWDLGPDFHRVITLDAARDPVMVVAARLIAGSFIFLVGVSLVLAHGQGFRPRAFVRRLAIIAGAALLVTIATRIAVPAGYVRFGILHSIAAATVIGAVFLRAPLWLLLAAAAAAFAAPAFLSSPFFDHPSLYWVGLSTVLPPTIDYVPVLPWVGAALLGMAAARAALSFGAGEAWSRWRPAGLVPRALVVAGRWSLPIYLVHQPLLLGAIYLLVLAFGGQPAMVF